jgi:hypothetical protein
MFTTLNTPFSLLRLADIALSAAGRAKKGKTPEATNTFRRVHEEMKLFGSPSPRKEAPADHRKKLLDPSTAMESASKKDEKSTSTISKIKSAFKAPVSHCTCCRLVELSNRSQCGASFLAETQKM